MCMGLGCHAVGITGCRIIDSRRERLIAMLTCAFVPCNGRLPTLIALCTLFFAVGGGIWGAIGSSVLLALMIIVSIIATLACSKILSKTLLRGEPSAFTLELPPYRIPKVRQVLVRSVLDRTLHVLKRAVCVAAPAGAILWLLANWSVEGLSLLSYMASYLDPLARFLCLDGAILLGFLLAIPANEIVLPVILMTYTASSGLVEYGSLADLGAMFSQNGWTAATAVATCLLMLFHFPCATALWTLKKESGRLRYVLLAAILPTVLGIVLCFFVFLCKILFF